jgi:hypothetical protein
MLGNNALGDVFNAGVLLFTVMPSEVWDMEDANGGNTMYLRAAVGLGGRGSACVGMSGGEDTAASTTIDCGASPASSVANSVTLSGFPLASIAEESLCKPDHKGLSPHGGEGYDVSSAAVACRQNSTV